MNAGERRFAEDRRVRNGAKANFVAGIAQVKADLGARSVPGRIADKARDEAVDVMATGIEIASQIKGIIAAVLAAIGLWTFRAPLLRNIKAVLNRGDQAEVQPGGDSDSGDE
ncbi:MAG: hypothetical protein JSR28_12190 [Proteobacteria bacterium]|nr:hypothetical protein [Pseudomonadota bacterium]